MSKRMKEQDANELPEGLDTLTDKQWQAVNDLMHRPLGYWHVEEGGRLSKEDLKTIEEILVKYGHDLYAVTDLSVEATGYYKVTRVLSEEDVLAQGYSKTSKDPKTLKDYKS